MATSWGFSGEQDARPVHKRIDSILIVQAGCGMAGRAAFHVRSKDIQADLTQLSETILLLRPGDLPRDLGAGRIRNARRNGSERGEINRDIS
jgi:hypothetical protein